MSQEDIINLLEEVHKPMSASEIATALEQNIMKICNDLRKLLQYSEVKAVEIDRHKAMKYFKSKRRLRIYFLDKKDLDKAKKSMPYL